MPSHQVSGAVSLFESFEPLPVNRWGMAPVWLWYTADFRLRSARTARLRIAALTAHSLRQIGTSASRPACSIF